MSNSEKKEEGKKKGKKKKKQISTINPLPPFEHTRLSFIFSIKLTRT